MPCAPATAAIVPKQDVSAGIREFRFLTAPDGSLQMLPFAADEDPAIHRIWPMHGICVGDQVYNYYHRISLLTGVDVFFNFKLDGMGISRATVGEFKFERLVAPDGCVREVELELAMDVRQIDVGQDASLRRELAIERRAGNRRVQHELVGIGLVCDSVIDLAISDRRNIATLTAMSVLTAGPIGPGPNVYESPV